MMRYTFSFIVKSRPLAENLETVMDGVAYCVKKKKRLDKYRENLLQRIILQNTIKYSPIEKYILSTLSRRRT